ncbi:hypothetical protein RDI58_000827 [Solanum bulbocastanum]|uniref:Uncharacterized protein n=1 Tax=Solanum bulbocastanum TaxID=147425 RepID=A0AAN8U895_SOLBU
MKGITKNISASFLTYHTLSSTFQDVAEEKPDGERKGEGGIRLSPFRLAAYKMQNDLYISTTTKILCLGFGHLLNLLHSCYNCCLLPQVSSC